MDSLKPLQLQIIILFKELARLISFQEPPGRTSSRIENCFQFNSIQNSRGGKELSREEDSLIEQIDLQFHNFNANPDACPLIACHLRDGGCGDNKPDIFSVNANNGPLIDTSTAIDEKVFLCCTVRSTATDKLVTSNRIWVTVGCPQLIKDKSSDRLSSITSNTYTYTINGNQPKVSISSEMQTISSSRCSIAYEIYESKGDGSQHSRLSVEKSGGKIKVKTTSSAHYLVPHTATFYIKVVINSGADSFWLESTSGSDAFSFEVVCPTLTFSEASDQPAAQHIEAGSATPWYTLPTITPSMTQCGTLVIEISSSNSATSTVSGMGSPTLSGGSYRASVTAANTEAKYEFYIRASVNSDEYYSGKKTLVVGCPADIGDLSISISQDGYSGSLTDSQLVSPNKPTSHFTLQDFSSSSTICPVLSYDIFTLNGGTVAPSGLSAPAVSGANRIVVPTDTSLMQTYQFYLRVGIQGGAVYDWSGPLQLELGCPASGITVTEGSYSGTFSNSQEVIVNDATATKFVLPAFSVSDPACTISYETTSSGSGAVSAVSGLPNPVLSGVEYIVVPTDITAEAAYSFYVKASSSDGSAFTSALTLRVGCPPGGASFSDSSNTTPVTVSVTTSTNVAVFTFVSPAVSGTNCALDSNALHDVKVDGSAAPTALAFSSGCIQPCTAIESSSLSAVQAITFKVKSLVNTGNDHYSPLFTVNVVCASAVNSITSSITAPETRTLSHQGSVTSISFPEFSCALSACCVLTYQTSSSSSVVAGVSGLISPPTVSGGSVSIPIPVDTIQIFEFWIHASNAEGITAVSSKVTVEIEVGCSSYPAIPSSEVPSSAELASSSQNVNITFSRSPDLSQKGFISGFAETVTSFSVDLSPRFAGVYSTSKCPNSNFQITKVASAGSTIDWTGLLEVTSAGVLSILDFTKTFDNYTVSMQAFNGAVWSSDYEILDLSIISMPVVLPQVAPTLVVAELEPQHTSVTSSEDKGELSIGLPETIDLNKDAVSIEVLNMEPYMSFNEAERVITIDLNQVNETSQFSLEIKLTDSTGKSTSYQQEIEVEVVEEEQPEEKKENLPPPIDLSSRFDRPSEEEEMEESFEMNAPEVKNVTARIKSIDNLGTVEIKFNSTMKSLASSTSLNPGTVDIYIEPVGGRNFPTGSLNLTSWSANNLTKDKLELKLSFVNPLEISPLEEQDTLIIHFKPEACRLFYSPSLQKHLHESSCTLRRKIRKQMPDTEFTQSFQEGAESTEASLLWVMVAVFVLNFVLSGGMIYMLFLVRYLQIVLHIPIMRIIVPSNLGMLFSVILPVATFDLLSPEWTTQVVLVFDDDEQIRLQDDMLDQMIDLGYETHSSLLNLGSLALFTLLYIVRVIFFLLLCFISAVTGHFGGLVSSLYKSLFFGEILAILLDAYFEFLIAGYLQVRAPLTSTLGERTSLLFGIFGLLLILIFLPGCFIMMLRQPREKLEDPEFEQSWGVLYEGMRTSSKWEVAYYPLFALRRVIYVGLAIFLKPHPSLQIIGLVLLNLASMVYIGHVQPQSVRLHRKIEMANELSILTVMISLAWFTDYLPDEATKYLYAWLPSGVVVLSIAFNLLFVVISGVRQIYLVSIKIFNRAAFLLKKLMSNFTVVKKEAIDHSMDQAAMIQKVHRMQKYARMKRAGKLNPPAPRSEGRVDTGENASPRLNLTFGESPRFNVDALKRAKILSEQKSTLRLL